MEDRIVIGSKWSGERAYRDNSGNQLSDFIVRLALTSCNGFELRKFTGRGVERVDDLGDERFDVALSGGLCFH